MAQTKRSVSSTDPEGLVQAEQVEQGWGVGQAAPNGKYAPLNPDGSVDYSKLSDKPIEGMGVQVVAEGDTITQALHDQLNA